MSNEIREAVQMVLTRMETHPEDFYDDMRINSRFTWVLNAISPNNEYTYGLNGAEIDALKKGYDGVMYRKFHDRVLESLLDGPQQDEKIKYKPVQYTDPRSIYGSIGQTTTAQTLHNSALNSPVIATSVQVGKQTLTEALVQKLKNL